VNKHDFQTFGIICLTYLLYFGQLGILTPYLGVFLDGRGFSSTDIGTLLAIITLTRIIGPSLWAGLADKYETPLKIMQIGCFLSAFLFAGVFIAEGFIELTLVFGLMMMFWTAVLPQLEVITLQHLKSSRISYGKIRLWGSVGFILFAVATGKIIDSHGSESSMLVSFLVLFALFLSSLFIKVAKRTSTPSRQSGAWDLALQRPFVVFILSSVLIQMSFGAFYGFFALYLRDLGYNGTQTGLLIALGVLAEVGMFLISSTIIERLGVRLTLFLCLFLTAVRWWVLGVYGGVLLLVVIAQCLHALSFGLTHATSVHFVHHFFPTRFQSRGQAIYISFSFGLGGAVGSYVSGYLWSNGSGAQLAFTVAGAMSLVGAFALFLTSKQSMDKQSTE
jgi:PPP family 3-phenylpropionic acid transporter